MAFIRLLPDLDHFLAKPVAIFNGKVITVKEAIKFEAHVQGGVHVGEINPKNPNEVAIEENLEFLGGYRPTLRQLVSLARVTIDALDPLYTAICHQ